MPAQEYLEKKKKKSIYTPDNDDRLKDGEDYRKRTMPDIEAEATRPGKTGKSSKDVFLPNEKKNSVEPSDKMKKKLRVK